LLVEAGMPREVIQFVPGDPTLFTEVISNSPDMASIAFTGSDKVFNDILRNVYGKIDKYRNYPRMVGETGGFNYHLVLPDISSIKDMDTIVNKTILGAFEYSGQKCSATSKLIVPNECIDYFIERLSGKMNRLQVGSPEEDNCFTSAVISEDSFNRAQNYILRNSSNVLAGGKCDNSMGYYIHPTLIMDENHALEKEYGEVFAPVLSICGYDPENLDETISHINNSKYALTTGVFTRNQVHFNKFNNTCGNLYFNDKSTGSIVGQQIFGGFRKSGTNDKAGSEHLLTRFGNIQTTKFSYELREEEEVF
jgi:1-pyrroline-5-carboxylate dehydrogenase